LKKKKTGKDKEANTESPEKVIQGGPYRNIEEAKKHMVSSFPDIKKVLI
jgi:hypothetical protein